MILMLRAKKKKSAAPPAYDDGIELLGMSVDTSKVKRYRYS